MAWFRAAVIAATLAAAGCTEGTGGGVEEPSDAITLALLQSCDFHYPNGTPVDCQADQAVEPEPAPPQGWFCVLRTDERRFGFELWSDGEGMFGVRYWQADQTLQGKMVARTRLLSESSQQRILIHADDDGFVRFPQAAGNEGQWTNQVMRFEASGTEPWMTTENLEVRTTDYQGWPWYVWVLTNGTQPHYLSKMLDPPDWNPVNEYHIIGDTFDLTVEAWSAYAERPYTYEMPLRPLGIAPPLDNQCAE